MEESGRKNPAVLPVFFIFLFSVTAMGVLQKQPIDLTQLSLEELMDIEVTLVSRKPELLFQAPAAISVLTCEDLHRLGVMHISDAFRWIPGMEVARIDANKWAVTARGSNSLYANKLLVLQDGRRLYSPIFSGVFWESQDFLFEDIDRVEVIRGPGATMWGANAVNGIINIITKDAMLTQGGWAQVALGTEEKMLFSLRYGGKFKNVAYRVYGKYHNTDGSVDSAGKSTNDTWTMSSVGFRVDGKPSPRDAICVMGDFHRAQVGQEGRPWLMQGISLGIPDYRAMHTSGHLTTRWKRSFSPTSQMVLQISGDQMAREDPYITEGLYRTFDFDFQHQFCISTRHELIWGMGSRITWDRMGKNRMVTFRPFKRTLAVSSAFIQDEINMNSDKIWCQLGSKFEHNPFTGYEIQPSFRLVWTPNDDVKFWSAVSKAVRTPSRADHDFLVKYSLGTVEIQWQGNPHIRSEKLLAWEMGTTVRPWATLLMNFNVFYNHYSELHLGNFGNVTVVSSPPQIILPFYLGNYQWGITKGGDASMDFWLSRKIRIHGGYSFLQFNSHPYASVLTRYKEICSQLGVDPKLTREWVLSGPGKSPEHQAFIRISANLVSRVKIDIGTRWVDVLSSIHIPAYWTADFRVAWQIGSALEGFLVGQNVFRASHQEFREMASPFQSTEIQRSVYSGLNVRF